MPLLVRYFLDKERTPGGEHAAPELPSSRAKGDSQASFIYGEGCERFGAANCQRLERNLGSLLRGVSGREDDFLEKTPEIGIKDRHSRLTSDDHDWVIYN